MYICTNVHILILILLFLKIYLTHATFHYFLTVLMKSAMNTWVVADMFLFFMLFTFRLKKSLASSSPMCRHFLPSSSSLAYAFDS